MKKVNNEVQKIIDGTVFFIGLFTIVGACGRYSLDNITTLQFIWALTTTISSLICTWSIATYINAKITDLMFK